jgi:CBS domain-containing protein
MFARAIELMDRKPLLFKPDTLVDDAAAALLARRVDGACVVDGGRLVGVVTVMDLLFQEREAPHQGLLTRLLDKTVFEKITGQTVGDIMSREVLTADASAELSELATLMVDRHLTVLPVVREGHILGVIDKWSLLNATSFEGVSDEPTHGGVG